MVTVAGHAYPWDVVGDPAFADRVHGLGLAGVTLAASYHSTRAATPLHPRHQLVDARWAALYRPVRDSAWAPHRLRPGAAEWMAEPDPFGAAADVLHRAGIPVTAWVVLTHSTRLGSAHPDLAVRNCFGEHYPYALCPANPQVRDYAATLAAEAVRDAPVDAVSLEACGQLGLAHLGHHEKTDDAWTPEAARLLSVCCCPACMSAWRERGLDPGEVVNRLRAGVRAEAGRGAGGPPPTSSEPSGQALTEQVANLLLATRHAATDALRAQVLAGLREVLPEAPVTLHAHPDPWTTGPSPGLTPSAAADVDALLVPAWPTVPATAETVARAASIGRPVDAYVTVLPPAAPDAIADHVRRLRDAGVTRFSLYHLGLAPAWRQRHFLEIMKVARDD
ncbi:hypothetical protein ACTMSW_08855 [Micromonospora sp. BQ11]|uniref:hypothetical protein n=1 Tax=Micromonospora sp. BQ11 TaxID=3452212 RepID=UPI003F89A94D